MHQHHCQLCLISLLFYLTKWMLFWRINHCCLLASCIFPFLIHLPFYDKLIFISCDSDSATPHINDINNSWLLKIKPNYPNLALHAYIQRTSNSAIQWRSHITSYLFLILQSSYIGLLLCHIAWNVIYVFFIWKVCSCYSLSWILPLPISYSMSSLYTITLVFRVLA